MKSPLGALLLVALVSSCGDSQGVAGAKGGVIHLDPRLGDGRSPAEVLGAVRQLEREWVSAGPADPRGDFDPWSFRNALFLETASGVGVRVRAADYAPERDVVYASLVHSQILDADSFNVVEVDVVTVQGGVAALRWRREGEAQQTHLLPLNLRTTEHPQTLRFALAGEAGWRGRVARLELIPIWRGFQSYELRAIRLLSEGFGLPDERVAGAGDGGVLGFEGDGRRTWPSDLDVALFARARVPPGGRLLVDTALPPGLHGLEDELHFAVDARATGSEAFETRAERSLVPASDPGAARWRTLTADLGDLAGREVELRLRAWRGATRAGSGLGGTPRRARVWWGAPMLVGDPTLERPPNVVLITLDTLRADVLGAYGGPVATPAIDRIAREGVLFEDAWSTSNATLPSHASILTGLAVPEHGALDNRSTLAAEVPTLTDALRAAGYHTAAAVSIMHLGAEFSGLGRGFDHFLDARPGAALDGAVTLAAVEGLFEVWRAYGERPLFLWVHLFDPHTPYGAPQPFRAEYEAELARAGVSVPPRTALPPTVPEGRYTRPGGFLEGVTNLDHARHVYATGVAYTDHLVGRLVELLEAQGCWEGAAVVLVADHGEALGEHDVWFSHDKLYPPVVRVPLVLRFPGGPAGVRLRARVSSGDIATTLARALGLADFGSRGEDLLALADGRGPGAVGRRVWFAYSGGVQVGSRDDELHHILTLADSSDPRPGLSMVAGQSLLYRHATDAACVDDLASHEPELAARRAQRARQWFEARASGRRVRRELSAEEATRLDAMGYGGDAADGEPRR